MPALANNSDTEMSSPRATNRYSARARYQIDDQPDAADPLQPGSREAADVQCRDVRNSAMQSTNGLRVDVRDHAAERCLCVWACMQASMHTDPCICVCTHVCMRGGLVLVPSCVVAIALACRS